MLSLAPLDNEAEQPWTAASIQTNLWRLPAPLGVKRLQLRGGGCRGLHFIPNPQTSAHGWGQEPAGHRERRLHSDTKSRWWLAAATCGVGAPACKQKRVWLFTKNPMRFDCAQRSLLTRGPDKILPPSQEGLSRRKHLSVQLHLHIETIKTKKWP